MRTRIKELRARFNWTQEELARRVNVRRETIVFLERGKYNPSLKLAYDISKAFKVSIEDVFIFDQENESISQLRTAAAGRCGSHGRSRKARR